MRIRPNDREKEVEKTVKRISSDELTFGDRKFSFDSVFDSDSKQVRHLSLSLYEETLRFLFLSYNPKNVSLLSQKLLIFRIEGI